MSDHRITSRALRRLIAISVIVVVGVLTNVILSKHAQWGNARLKVLGGSIWSDYNTKGLASKPTCDLDTLKADLARAELALKTEGAQGEDRPQAEEGDLLDDLVDEDDDSSSDDTSSGEGASGQGTSDGGSGEDDLDDLLAEDDGETGETSGASAAPEAQKAAQQKLRAQRVTAYKRKIKICEESIVAYRKSQAPMGGGEVAFRGIQSLMVTLNRFGDALTRPSLVLLFLLCGLIATLRRHHIALRPAEGQTAHIASEVAQLISMVMLSVSFWYYRALNDEPGLLFICTLWVVGFATLALCNFWNLLRVLFNSPREESTTEQSFLKGLLLMPNYLVGYLISRLSFSVVRRYLNAHLDRIYPHVQHAFKTLISIPLYSLMCLISGIYFFLVEYHPSGLAIYISKLHQNASLYLNVGLYVWVGMMLKNTMIAQRSFDVIRPFRLPPELLAFVIIVGSALPTAYSGASGIFVIAAGALIFNELKQAGARTQLALATTAMSGSMGVVLRPCLLVFIVASLNNTVTSDELYSWGVKVFALSATLFLLVSLMNRQESEPMAPISEGMSGALKAIKPLSVYLAIMGVLVLLYALLVEAYLDENSAPFILPVLIIAALFYEASKEKRAHAHAQLEGESSPALDEAPRSLFGRLRDATDETTIHIGALLVLMGLSVCIGGIVERSEVMSALPESLGSVWVTMSLLVVVLVIIGMTMDPYGAVILVSATIAQVAYKNGVHPVHFWMTVLVAFELGYLTPPVALNHLLTRQVIGEEAFINDEARLSPSFYTRHERILLPVIVMGITLLIVAFGPLVVGY